MMITASSACSSMRIKALGQGDPLTVTEKPLARALAVNERVSSFAHKRAEIDEIAEDEATGSLESDSCFSSAAAIRPRDAKDGSISRSDTVEERIKVADTDVISLTAREREGAHGRMACHCGDVDGDMQTG